MSSFKYAMPFTLTEYGFQILEDLHISALSKLIRDEDELIDMLGQIVTCGRLSELVKGLFKPMAEELTMAVAEAIPALQARTLGSATTVTPLIIEAADKTFEKVKACLIIHRDDINWACVRPMRDGKVIEEQAYYVTAKGNVESRKLWMYERLFF